MNSSRLISWSIAMLAGDSDLDDIIYILDPFQQLTSMFFIFEYVEMLKESI